jgi:hypothetical protein
VPTFTDQAQRDQALVTLKATTPLYGTGEDLGRIDKTLWPKMADFMSAAGLLTAPVDPSDAFAVLP